MNDFWIILIGILVAATCGLLGSYLILRRMAMVGDAIAHAVLPGIVIAFMISESRDSIPMLLGAAAVGLLTTFLIETLHRRGMLQIDASIGLTYTSLFALGVILTSAFTGDVDLDLDCILYGEIALAPLYTLDIGGVDMGPRAVWIVGGALVLVLAFIFLGYKELYITTFDPAYAAIIGVSVSLWHYLLMGAVSLTTVAAFESVGAILVVAFLIAPPAAAYLLTDNFKHMLLLTVLLGSLAVVGGYYLAAWLDASIAGAMALCMGLVFCAAFGVYRRRIHIASKSLTDQQPAARG